MFQKVCYRLRLNFFVVLRRNWDFYIAENHGLHRQVCVLSSKGAFSLALGVQKLLSFFLADFGSETLFDVLIVHLHFVKVMMALFLFLLNLLNGHLSLHFVVVNVLYLLGNRLGILLLEICLDLFHMLLTRFLFFQQFRFPYQLSFDHFSLVLFLMLV